MSFDQAVWLAFLFVAGTQTFAWALFLIQLLRLRSDAKKRTQEAREPISLIIAARNEEANLLNHLPAWIDQLNEEDEVVVVNDRSADNTALVLHAFEQRHAQVKVVTIKPVDAHHTVYGKKFALTLGIKAARHDRLAFTDADCWPNDASWMDRMGQEMQDVSLVLGNGFVKHTSSFVSRIAHYDSLHTAILYQSFARMGIPYMGVGRSLAYHRELFHRQQGFRSHQHIQSGDDDLFVSSLKNAKVKSQLAALTWTEAPPSLDDYFRQKTRHSSTSFHYKWHHQMLLGVYYTSLALFWPLFIAALFLGDARVASGLLLIRLSLQFASLFLLGKMSQSKLGLLATCWSEVIVAVIYPVFTLAAKWKKRHRWKS